MSTYYNFYLGYKTKDGLYHAYGPYDKFNNLCSIYNRSRSFIGIELVNSFIYLDVEKLDDELKQKFTWLNGDKLVSELSYLPVNWLGSTDYIKHGYYPREDISEYIELEEVGEAFEFEYSESYREKQYLLLLENAVKENNQEEIERLKKFNFFSYPDYNSSEYGNFILNSSIGYNGLFELSHVEDILKKANIEVEQYVFLMETS